MYDNLSDAIFRHCYFRVHDRDKAKELMQETFMKTWEYLNRGNEIENLRAFIYRVANNLVIDSSRKKKEGSLEKMQEDGFQPSGGGQEKIQNIVDAKLAVASLKRIDKKYQDVLLMRYVDDLGPKEISEILDETENNISVRIHRGLQQLRKL